MIKQYQNKLIRRKLRVRAKLKKVSVNIPRLSIFRSNKHIYAQVIDISSKGKILTQASDSKLKEKGGKINKAGQVGQMIANFCKKKGIKKVIFDRSGYKFSGRIKMLAQSAKKDGLIF